MNKFQTGILSELNLSSVKTHEVLELRKMTKNVSKTLRTNGFELDSYIRFTYIHCTI